MRATIILADDQPAVLEEIRSLLEPTFEILDMVTNGEALLEAVKRLHPDLVVVDISMPGMSGLETVRRLCKCADAPGVVFLTIHDSREMVTEALRVGALGYVLKAFADTEHESRTSGTPSTRSVEGRSPPGRPLFSFRPLQMLSVECYNCISCGN